MFELVCCLKSPGGRAEKSCGSRGGLAVLVVGENVGGR